jgi:quercetin dioxygenase-like cupin family protein
MKIVNTKINFEDERGFIKDLIENEEINSVTLISINKGCVRANHVHKHTRQYNFIIKGKIKLVTKFPGKEKKETILHPGDIAYSEPMEEHALYGEEYSEFIVLTNGPRGGQNYESDTFRLKEKLI